MKKQILWLCIILILMQSLPIYTASMGGSKSNWPFSWLTAGACALGLVSYCYYKTTSKESANQQANQAVEPRPEGAARLSARALADLSRDRLRVHRAVLVHVGALAVALQRFFVQRRHSEQLVRRIQRAPVALRVPGRRHRRRPR